MTSPSTSANASDILARVMAAVKEGRPFRFTPEELGFIKGRYEGNLDLERTIAFLEQRPSITARAIQGHIGEPFLLTDEEADDLIRLGTLH